MKISRLAATMSTVSFCLALGACGGGGVTSTPAPAPAPSPAPAPAPSPSPAPAPTPSPSPAPTPAPTPTPAPAPTPSPTPGPSPTPEPTYATLAELWVEPEVDLPTWAVAVDASTAEPSIVPLGSGPTIKHSTEGGGYYLITTPSGDRIYATEKDQNGTPWNAIYENNGLAVHSIGGYDEVDFKYTLAGYWTFDSIIFAFVSGVPTLASDLPRWGTGRYLLQGGGALRPDPGGKWVSPTTVTIDGSMTVDFRTGKIDTAFQPRVFWAEPQDLGYMTGRGQVSSDGSGFTGSLENSAADGSGVFHGSFFGPSAMEVGYSWAYLSSDISMDGILYGQEDSVPRPPLSGPEYQRLDEIDGPHTFNTAGAVFEKAEGTYPTADDASLFTYGDGVTIEYSKERGTYLLSAPGRTEQTFGPNDAVSPWKTIAGSRTWVVDGAETQDRLTLVDPVIDGVRLSYTQLGKWEHLDASVGMDRVDLLVAGVPTLPEDLVASGNGSYTAEVVDGTYVVPSSGATYSLAGSYAAIHLMAARGFVQTYLDLRGEPAGGTGSAIEIGMAVGSAELISDTSAFTGMLSLDELRGEFSGAFFGPRGAEAGYAWYLAGDDAFAQGLVAGVKD